MKIVGRGILISFAVWLGSCGGDGVKPVAPTVLPSSTPAPPRILNFQAMSGGYSSGTSAKFLRNGTSFYTGSRGFSVVGINMATGETVKPATTFDTWATRSFSGDSHQRVIDTLSDFPNGTLILIAVSDEAGLTLDDLGCLPSTPPGSLCCRPLGKPWADDLIRSLESLGADQIRNYCYRNSWAMIAVKGQGSKGEGLRVLSSFAVGYEFTLP